MAAPMFHFHVEEEAPVVSNVSDRGLFPNVQRDDRPPVMDTVRFRVADNPTLADLWMHFDNRMLWTADNVPLTDMNAPLLPFRETTISFFARPWTPEYEHLRADLVAYKKARIVDALKKRAADARAKFERDEAEIARVLANE